MLLIAAEQQMFLKLWVYCNILVLMCCSTVRLVLFDFERLLCSPLPHNKIALTMKCFLPDRQPVSTDLKPDLQYRQLSLYSSFCCHVPSTGNKSQFTIRDEPQIYSKLETLMNVCVRIPLSVTLIIMSAWYFGPSKQGSSYKGVRSMATSSSSLKTSCHIFQCYLSEVTLKYNNVF